MFPFLPHPLLEGREERGSERRRSSFLLQVEQQQAKQPAQRSGTSARSGTYMKSPEIVAFVAEKIQRWSTVFN
jgi:hypothetical protein